IFLERRLDNAVYRSGFATSRKSARQLVTHGHFTLNGRRVDIPSVRLKVGDEIVVRPHSTKSGYFKNFEEVSPKPSSTPAWIKVDRKNLKFSVTNLPTRDDAEEDIKEQLIVEFYSR
ncbi:30S ribosomal protein S4, partial [Candidatus Saccharibacteria bacterium]|nr:30S ribosomal protein S4 [Candidatus Saccharibacteria bacterium]